jgi:hypothetical protein
VGTPTVFKAQCGDGGGGDTMVLEDALLCPSTWLVTTRTMGLIAFWKYDVRFFWQNSGAILYFPLSLESFDFVNEFHQLLSQKKKKFDQWIDQSAYFRLNLQFHKDEAISFQLKLQLLQNNRPFNKLEPCTCMTLVRFIDSTPTRLPEGSQIFH